ncbi:tetratricopeptide repeat protein [candidate division WOR-3 bacterium]|nr:tetratricopeptide repeat protein [candidate division WOR-3 bacterium]
MAVMKTVSSWHYAVSRKIMNKRVIIIVVLLAQLVFADVGSSMRKGNHLYHQGEYEEALAKYQEALVLEPDNPKIHYNIARALYKLEKYPEAIGEFQMGLLEKNRDFQADVFYNIGNCKFKQGQLDAAIESYTMSLLVDHKDEEAKQNLEFCLKVKEQLEQQQQSDSTEHNEQEQQQQKQEQPQPQPQQGGMNQEQAERILQALQSREKENLEKARQPETKARVEKDW